MQFTRTNILTDTPGGKSMSSGGIILEGNQGGGGSYEHPTGWLWGNKYTGKEILEGDLTSNGTIKCVDLNATNISSINLTSVNGQFTNLNVGNNFFANHVIMNDATIQDLYVSGSAHFVELIIDKINSTNGTLVLSPAHATLSRTEIDDTTHTITCYFKASDGEKKISNDFDVDDLVICQSFNAVEGVSHDVDNKFIWKRCIAKGTTQDGSEHWIKFYTTEWLKETYAALPNKIYCPLYHGSTNAEFEAEDALCTLGNWTNKNRQKAMMLSATNGAWMDNYLLDTGDLNVYESFGGVQFINEGDTKVDYIGYEVLTSPLHCSSYIPDDSVPTQVYEGWVVEPKLEIFGNNYPDDYIIPTQVTHKFIDYDTSLKQFAGDSYSILHIPVSRTLFSSNKFNLDVNIRIKLVNVNGAENGYNNLFRIGPYDFLGKNKYTKDGVKYIELAVCWYGKCLGKVNMESVHPIIEISTMSNQTKYVMIQNGAWLPLVYEAADSMTDKVRDGFSNSTTNEISFWLGDAGCEVEEVLLYEADDSDSDDFYELILEDYITDFGSNLIQNGDFSDGINDWTSNGFAIGTSLTQAGNYLYADESYKSYVGHTYSNYKDGAEHLNMAFNSDGSFLNDFYAASCAWGTEGIDKLTTETSIEQTINLTGHIGTPMIEFDALCDIYSKLNGDRSFKLIIENEVDHVEKIIKPTSNNTHKYRFSIDTHYSEPTPMECYPIGQGSRYNHTGVSEGDSYKRYMYDGRGFDDDASDSDYDYSSGINITDNFIQIVHSPTNTYKIRIEMTETSEIELFCLSNFNVKVTPFTLPDYPYVETYKYLLVPYTTVSSGNYYYTFGLCKYKVEYIENSDNPYSYKILSKIGLSNYGRGIFHYQEMTDSWWQPTTNPIKAPCLITFDGIDSFSLAGKQISVISPSYNQIQASAVSGLDGAIESSSSFKVLADRIESTVTQGELSSLIRQMADSIELSVFSEMGRSGIDITNGSIVLDATKTEITGDLTLSDINQGLNIQDQGVDKIVIQNSSLGNLSDFDFGADKQFHKSGISSASSTITYTETLGSFSATTPLSLTSLIFDASDHLDSSHPSSNAWFSGYSYQYTIYCNGSSVTSISGSISRNNWTVPLDDMTPLSITSLSSTGTYTIEFSITNMTFSGSVSNVDYWFDFKIKSISPGVNRIGLDGAVFSTDTSNWNWMGPDFTAFRRENSQLDIDDEGIYRTGWDSERNENRNWQMGDISSTIPVSYNNSLTHTASYKDGLIVFSTVIGESDGAQRTLTLPDPSSIAPGKWFMGKNIVGDNTHIQCGTSSNPKLIKPGSNDYDYDYNIGNKSFKVVNDGFEWIIFYCG